MRISLKRSVGCGNEHAMTEVLIIRASLLPKRRRPWSFWFQNLILRLTRVSAYYRPVHQLQSMVVRSGFQVEQTLASGCDEELVWLVARKG